MPVRDSTLNTSQLEIGDWRSTMAVSAIRNWWNTHQLDKSDTNDSEEDEEELAGRRQLSLNLSQTLRTRQLLIDFDGGRPILSLRAPLDLVTFPSISCPRWPIECDVIGDIIHHIEWDPPEPEPFYQPTGHERTPMPAGEERKKVVYCTDYATKRPYFTCSRVGGSRGPIKSATSYDNQTDFTLEFESRFESGNLQMAAQVGVYDYELTLRTDMYTRKHTQWFYFRVRNMKAGVSYRFTIINLMKSSSLYSQGMRPLLYSERAANEKSVGWQRAGSNIGYYRNGSQNTKDNNDDTITLCSLTWTLQFPYDSDTCYLAHCYPYTYSHLQRYLRCITSNPAVASYCTLRVLCHSLAGNAVYVVTITSRGVGREEGKTKKAVVVTARVHPGETNGSWMMEGLLDFLLGDSEDAQLLRDTFVFKVVPMLNPDGVVVGNYRCSLAGRDLNRNYKTLLRDSFPCVWHTRNMVERLMAETDVVLYCDFHGHNRKNNVFMYGCNSRGDASLKLHERVFPLMMSKNASNKFSFNSCKFRVQKSKEGTGRIAMWKLGIKNSYTMEATFGGSTLGMKRPFSPSPLANAELDRRGFGAGLEVQMDGEPCCDTQDEGAVLDEQSLGGDLPSALCRPKRERKQRSYTMCDVCNIQLNSAAQAQIHYNGKSHQKRLKQISNGKMPSNTGTSAQGSPLLASLPVPGRPLQPQLDLKHLLPFRLNGSSPLSLFPNFNTMDPVQKAVINHTFGVPQPLKKKQIISCNICHLRFNSTNQAEAHYKGHKHARKLKAMEAQKNRQRRAGEASSTGRERDRDRDRERDRDRSKTSTSEAALPALMDTSSVEGASPQSDQEPANPEGKLEESPRSSVMLTPVSEVSSVELVTLSPPQISPSSQLSETASDTSAPEAPEAIEAAGPITESGSHGDASSIKEEPPTDEDKDPKKSKAHLHCPVCKVTVNSVSQLEAHNSGTKHKLMLEGHSVLPRRRGKVVAARAGCKSKRLASKGSVGLPTKNFQCEVCEIFVNSETQLSQHMNSRRHKDRLAGKPPKPKFTPHSKSQPSTSLANVRWSGYAGMAVSAMKKAFSQYNLASLSSQTKLALQKQLTKTLTTGFLPSPLTQPTLCTMANPLALRHPVGTTFIQSPFLGPALFRPAPGPLRATHTPIIFSPY